MADPGSSTLYAREFLSAGFIVVLLSWLGFLQRKLGKFEQDERLTHGRISSIEAKMNSFALDRQGIHDSHEAVVRIEEQIKNYTQDMQFIHANHKDNFELISTLLQRMGILQAELRTMGDCYVSVRTELEKVNATILLHLSK